MVKLIEIIPQEERCKICGKRRATRLCDFITGEWQWGGHNPNAIPIGDKMYVEVGEESRMHGTTTCDAKICEKCSTCVGHMDFCPDHVREIKLVIRK